MQAMDEIVVRTDGTEPKTRHQLIEDYRKELQATKYPRDHRRTLLLAFRKELTKRGVP